MQQVTLPLPLAQLLQRDAAVHPLEPMQPFLPHSQQQSNYAVPRLLQSQQQLRSERFAPQQLRQWQRQQPCEKQHSQPARGAA